MQFSANVAELRIAYNAVSPVIPDKSPNLAVPNALLKIEEDGTAYLIANNLEHSIRYRVLGITSGGPGEVLLSKDLFGKILKFCGGDELRFDVSENKMKITGKGFKHELQTTDPALFPDVPVFSSSDFHQIPEAELARLIKLTHFACDPDGSRYALGGTCFEFTDAFELSATATDGHCLANAKSKAVLATGSGGDSKEQKVVPLKSLKFLTGFLSGSGEDAEGDMAEIAFTGRSFVVRTDRADFRSNLLEGTFPRWRDTVARFAECKHKAVVKVRDLRDGINQASVTTSTESRGLTFDFRPDPASVTIRGTSSDKGHSETEIDLISYSGGEFATRMSPDYITPMLGAVAPDAEVTIGCVGKNQSVFFVVGDYEYIVQPLSLEAPKQEPKPEAVAV